MSQNRHSATSLRYELAIDIDFSSVNHPRVENRTRQFQPDGADCGCRAYGPSTAAFFADAASAGLRNPCNHNGFRSVCKIDATGVQPRVRALKEARDSRGDMNFANTHLGAFTKFAEPCSRNSGPVSER
jgi:hypothetical protein